jgi:hypothetical protein
MNSEAHSENPFQRVQEGLMPLFFNPLWVCAISPGIYSWADWTITTNSPALSFIRRGTTIYDATVYAAKPSDLEYPFQPGPKYDRAAIG